MILSALDQYYRRKTTEPGSDLPPFGIEEKGIPFLLEIDTTGNLNHITDTREGEGKKKTAKTFWVPKSIKKTSGIVANLLWDPVDYALGLDTKGKPDRATEQHRAFIDKIEALAQRCNDEGLLAVVRFLSQWNAENLQDTRHYDEFMKNPVVTFRLQGDYDPVCCRPAVVDAIRCDDDNSTGTALCLVSGEFDVPTKLHPAIKGVWGAQSSGSNIVSFNLDAFNSYGKKQGDNAQVGARVVFNYTTALNYLLRKNSTQRVQIGDASTIFWAEKACELEAQTADIFGEPTKDDPDANTRAVKALYRSIDTGDYGVSASTKFFVLGLSPNAARISIRFWQQGTVASLARAIQQHFDDLQIARGPNDPQYPSLFRLLANIAAQGKADNIPPNLAGSFAQSVLTRQPYPQTLLAAAVRRNRAEQRVSYLRAALIKAYINRQSNPQEALNVTLNIENDNAAYRLGRLFAALEKIQEEANPGINATIRDRYYGAASATPASVLPTLLKLKNHHISKLSKLKQGRAIFFEKLLGEIHQGVTSYPANFSLLDQGQFSIGYYHQRQDFFTKHDINEDKRGEQQ